MELESFAWKLPERFRVPFVAGEPLPWNKSDEMNEFREWMLMVEARLEALEDGA